MDAAEVSALKLVFKTATDNVEWSTVAVTVGVSIEFLALFVFSKEMPRKEKWIMAFATLLIVVGCAGEYIYGERATGAATQLQEASDSQVASLEKDAKAAEEKIADTEKAAAIAMARAGEANERAANLEKETLTLKISLQEAEEKTAKAEKELLGVEAAALPRQMLISFALHEEIKKYADVPVLISWFLDDEPSRFARGISVIFEWPGSPKLTPLPSSKWNDFEGVKIQYADPVRYSEGDGSLDPESLAAPLEPNMKAMALAKILCKGMQHSNTIVDINPVTVPQKTRTYIPSPDSGWEEDVVPLNAVVIRVGHRYDFATDKLRESIGFPPGFERLESRGCD
jgi:hypothetical protein